MNPHNVTIKQRLARSVVLCAVVLWSAVPCHAGDVAVNGRLDNIGPFPVLRVWGTPDEMGFAQGFLLGSKIAAGNRGQLSLLHPDVRAGYDKITQPILSAIDIPQDVRAELQGILRGIEAAHQGPVKIDDLKRNLQLSDLILANAGDMTRAFQCSGFTAWGEQTGDQGVITTRNFDYSLFYPGALDDQMILVRQPKDRHQVATVTWPGYIGAFTGINDAGVCTFMHDGTGPMLEAPAGKYRPVALALKELLESSDSAAAHARANQLLREVAPYPFSYMLRIVTPSLDRTGYKPVRVFRIDAGGMSENPVGDARCITTNHYLSPSHTPAKNAGNWSLKRFRRLDKRFAGTITPRIAWDALRSVSVADVRSGTLHSLVVYPDRKMLDLAFAKRGDRGVAAATASSPTRIEFSELFAKRR